MGLFCHFAYMRLVVRVFQCRCCITVFISSENSINLHTGTGTSVPCRPLHYKADGNGCRLLQSINPFNISRSLEPTWIDVNTIQSLWHLTDDTASDTSVGCQTERIISTTIHAGLIFGCYISQLSKPYLDRTMKLSYISYISLKMIYYNNIFYFGSIIWPAKSHIINKITCNPQNGRILICQSPKISE